MSVYSVVRKVDTVIVEMDISNAEALLEVLGGVEDLSIMSSIDELAIALRNSGEIREPSPSYEFNTFGASLVNRTREMYEKAYFDYHGTLDECDDCGGQFNRHYLDCKSWNINKS